MRSFLPEIATQYALQAGDSAQDDISRRKKYNVGILSRITEVFINKLLINMEIIKIPVGRLQANCFLLIDSKSKKTLIIDPGDDADLACQKILDEKLKPLAMLTTHGHFDHVMAAMELQENFKIPFYMDKKDEFLLKRLSQTAEHFLGEKVEVWPPRQISYFDKDKIFKNFNFQIIPTPGHTPGSVSFYFKDQKSVFVGDVLFAGGGFGRTDFSYCSSSDLQQSIQKLLELPDETIIYSGHGEESRIRRERKYYD